MALQNYYTRQEIADKLKVDIRTVDNWVKKGLLKGMKVERSVRFPESQVIKLLEKQKSE